MSTPAVTGTHGSARAGTDGSAATETYVYVMPSLGADMDEGAVVEWFVQPGDAVHRGDVVARVETDKSDVDIEIWVDGVVQSVEAETHRTLSVGTPLLHVDRSAAGESAPSSPAVDSGAPSAAAASEPEVTPPARESTPRAEAREPRADGAEPTPVVSRNGADEKRVGATPYARRRADELSVDLGTAVGTGPGGAIRARDVEAASRTGTSGAAGQPAATAPAAPTVPTSGTTSDTAPPGASDGGRSRAERMRAAIAERMVRSNTEIPHYRLERLVDVSVLLARLDEHNRDAAVAARVVPTAAFVSATALALARHPGFNGTWQDGRFVPSASVDLAVAISLRSGGLVAPTLVAADRLDLVATMRWLREMTTAIRKGVVRNQWFEGTPATTVTSLVDRGPDVVHGLITVPQTSLVGFGRIADRPIVVDGEVVARPTVVLSLDADHRVSDGADGGRFVDTLATLLESGLGEGIGAGPEGGTV